MSWMMTQTTQSLCNTILLAATVVVQGELVTLPAMPGVSPINTG